MENFAKELAIELRTKLEDRFDVVSEYSSDEQGWEEVHDIAILEDGHLRMILDATEDEEIEHIKPEMRKFYEKTAGDSNFVLAACQPDRLAIFDAENQILSEGYQNNDLEGVAENIADFLH